MIGDVLLHYSIQEKLGEGGMGVVYKALDQKLNRSVALKFLPEEMATSSAGVQRFLIEANALSALNHPHIATIYGLEEVGNQRFLVLEYLPGGTLKDKLYALQCAQQELPIPAAVEYARQTAEGLSHAHRRGIVHRDVKSSNLMLTEDGQLKITDFGIAKLSNAPIQTLPGTIVGTMAYMSPEQAQGEEVDTRSDIFSFGVVLFELITGQMPFQASTPIALLEKVAKAELPPLASLRRDAPPALQHIVSKALRRRREERYQRMEDLLNELQILQGARPDPMVLSTITAPPSRPVSLPRPPIWLIVGLLVAGLAVAATAYLSLRHPQLRTSPPGQRLPAQKYLAVLPFHNAGGDAGQQAFSAGLMEILTNKLTQLERFQGSLRVVSASDVLKEGVTSAKEARKAFGATVVLTGSIHRLGQKVVLTANLVDSATQLALAARDLEAPVENVSALPEALLQRVAEMLELQLQPEVWRTIGTTQTAVPGAYELYLQARGYLQRYDRAENLDHAIAALQRALAQDPGFALAHAGLAEAHLRRHQLTKDPALLVQASGECQRAIELNDHLAAIHSTMGLIQTSSGNYPEAIRSLEKSLELEPANPDAYRELANAYDAMGRPKDAEATFRRAIQLRENYWAAYKDLGVFYTRHGRLAEALPQFQRVIELTPDNYLGYSNLGGLYLELGKREQAAAMLEKSLALKPTAPALANLGSVYYFLNRYSDASEMYHKAIELNPADPRYWGSLAASYRWMQGMGEQSRQAYQQAIFLAEKQLAANARDANLRSRIGLYWSALGNEKKALEEIEQAVESSPGAGYVLFRATIVYEQSGMRDRALEALKSAVQSGYSLEEVKNAPELHALRRDPRYQATVASRAPNR